MLQPPPKPCARECSSPASRGWRNLRTSTISSTVRPAKYRSSTTLALRVFLFRETGQRLVHVDEAGLALRWPLTATSSPAGGQHRPALSRIARTGVVHQNRRMICRHGQKCARLLKRLAADSISRNVRFVDQGAVCIILSLPFSLGAAHGRRDAVRWDNLDQTIEGAESPSCQRSATPSRQRIGSPYREGPRLRKKA